MARRGPAQKLLDTLTFPIRAISLFEDDRWGLSSLRTERFDYVASAVRGECLDVGCGRGNLFVREMLGGRGRGVDVYAYDGLADEDLLDDPTSFPFPDGSFDSVTFIANLNHVPEPMRDAELAEARRCLRAPGRIIVTMGHPLAEIAVHQVVRIYDAIFGTDHDMDGERGMEEDEAYYLTPREIRERLRKAGFGRIERRLFWTQWGLNSMYIGHHDGDAA